ncbi:MAG TPA: hypothetical protein VMO17_00220, partial [Terriglobia bacterium]|nr:hypothetical protein [Terriglobia bacterium]
MGNVREWLFTPRLRFADFTEMNGWLARRCRELAGRRHPAEAGRTVAECFAEEQPLLRPVTAVFDGHVEQVLRVSSTCLVHVDRNRYSVPANWAGKVVSVRLTADALRIVADGVNKLKRADNAQLVITHYQRLLNYIVPDFVHVLVDGRIVRTGDKKLALELEAKGYD